MPPREEAKVLPREEAPRLQLFAARQGFPTSIIALAQALWFKLRCSIDRHVFKEQKALRPRGAPASGAFARQCYGSLCSKRAFGPADAGSKHIQNFWPAPIRREQFYILEMMMLVKTGE